MAVPILLHESLKYWRVDLISHCWPHLSWLPYLTLSISVGMCCKPPLTSDHSLSWEGLSLFHQFHLLIRTHLSWPLGSFFFSYACLFPIYSVFLTNIYTQPARWQGFYLMRLAYRQSIAIKDSRPIQLLSTSSSLLIGFSIPSFHMTPGKSISNPDDLARLSGMGQRIKDVLPMDLSLGGWENGVSLKMS